MSRIQDLRDYYDSHDTSESMEEGQWEVDTVDDPMITTSLRLPKSLLDWVRERASAEHMKPSAWIRTLVERARSGEGSLERRVDALEKVIFAVAGHSPHASPSAPPAPRESVPRRNEQKTIDEDAVTLTAVGRKVAKEKPFPEVAAGVRNKVAAVDKLTPKAKTKGATAGSKSKGKR